MKHRHMIGLAVAACGMLLSSATLIAQSAAPAAAPVARTAPLPAPATPMGYGPNGKPYYLFMVFSNPTQGQEEEYHRWYDRIHSPVVIEGGDYVWAQRFVLTGPDVRFGGGGLNEPGQRQYVVIFAAESNDIKKTLEDVKRSLALPRNVRSAALDYASTNGLNWQAVGPLITQKQAKELLAAEEKAGRLPAMDAPIPPDFASGGARRGGGPPRAGGPGAAPAPVAALSPPTSAQTPVAAANPTTRTAPLPAPAIPMGYGPNGKPYYLFMVFSDPTPGQEEEYNAWYDRIHAPVVIEGGDFIWAQRFVQTGPDVSFGGGNTTTAGKRRYVVIFAAESNDIKKTLEDVKRRLALPRNVRSAALDYGTLAGLDYQAVGPLITQKYARELLAAEEKAGRLPAMDAPIPPGFRGGVPGRGGGAPGTAPGPGAAPSGPPPAPTPTN